MFRFAVSKVTPLAMRPVAALATTAPRATAAVAAQRFCTAAKGDDEEIVKVVLAESLEWTLSSPPPIHQFDEPPIIVEIGEA